MDLSCQPRGNWAQMPRWRQQTAALAHSNRPHGGQPGPPAQRLRWKTRNSPRGYRCCRRGWPCQVPAGARGAGYSEDIWPARPDKHPGPPVSAARDRAEMPAPAHRSREYAATRSGFRGEISVPDHQLCAATAARPQPIVATRQQSATTAICSRNMFDRSRYLSAIGVGARISIQFTSHSDAAQGDNPPRRRAPSKAASAAWRFLAHASHWRSRPATTSAPCPLL